MIQTVFSIKQVNVDAALKEAENKAKNSAAKIDKSLQGAGKGAGKGVKDSLQQAGKGMESINKLGGKMGGVFKNATEALTGMLSPIGLITAGITALVALGVKMWDKFTQSAEQYSQKVAIGAERAKKQQQDLNKAQAQDKGYLKRLQDLAKAENLSNAEKIQAAKLIDILNRSYSNLGLSIDMATGKIKGLDNAQMEMLNRMQQLAIEKAENVVSSQENLTSDAVKNAMGSGGIWAGYNPINFGDPSKSLSVSLAHNWNNMALRNGDKGLKDLKTSFLSSDAVKKLATQLEITRKKAADLKAQMAQNPSTVTDADRERLQALQNEAKHTETLLKLQQKLEVSQSMIKAAKTGDDIAKWKKVQQEIRKLITAYKNLKLQKDVVNKVDSTPQIKYDAAKKQRQSIDRQIEQQTENQKYSGLTKKQKIKFHYQVETDLAAAIKKLNADLQTIEKSAQPKRARQKELQGKLAAGKISSKEQAELLKIDRELLAIDTRIEGVKKNISSRELERLRNQAKITEYEREVKKYYDDHKNNLNAEIKVQKLLNAGKNEAAERQKLINDLKKQGLTVDSKQLDLIMKKRKQLAGLKMKDAFSSEAEKLLATVGKQVNGKQAEFQQRVADYEQKYGVKLSKSQKNAIQTLIDVESEIADMPKLSFKGMEIKTDELTARGGNAGGAVAPDKNAVNAQIRDYSRNQVKLLTDIKQTLKNAGII